MIAYVVFRADVTVCDIAASATACDDLFASGGVFLEDRDAFTTQIRSRKEPGRSASDDQNIVYHAFKISLMCASSIMVLSNFTTWFLPDL